MPSIFIWKSNKSNASKKTIKVYSGSNWMLEDNDFSSKSSQLLEQIVIPNIEGFNGSVISYYTKTMPQDWVGSDLLEVTNIPYQMVKDDTYGALEQLGSWMRFTLKGSMNFDKDSLVSELATIRNWIEIPVITQNVSTMHRNQRQDFKHTNHIKNNYKQRITNKQFPKQTLHIDPNKVQKDFQEFLIQFDFNKYTSQMLPIQSNILQNMNNMMAAYDN